MNAEIINVGNELLLGNTANINAQVLSRKLLHLGIDVNSHIVIKDEPNTIKKVTLEAIDRSDIVIFTGGLGPTHDDMTKEVVAETLGLNMNLNKEEVEEISNYFNKNNIHMSENNIKQAYIPQDSYILKNEIGTAPGIFIKKEDVDIILLPGPTKEMEIMFDKYVIPLLNVDNYIVTKTIKTIGIGESSLEELIQDIIKKYDNPIIATYAKSGQVDICLTATGKNEEEASNILQKVFTEIENKVGSYIYGYDDESIEEVIYKKLKNSNLKIAFCESCTGGLVSSKFTSIPGVSEVFERGIVTYSNYSKIQELNVSKETLNKFGAVSKETAMEMAEGLLGKTKVDIAVSTTGIAGPTGSTKDKPVGLVYIGVATKKDNYAIECNFTGNRNTVQNKAANRVFYEIIKYLFNNID